MKPRPTLHEAAALAEQLAEVLRRLAGAQATRRPEPTSSPKFTARQLEVGHLLCQGLPRKAIAARLRVSESSVRQGIDALARRLGTRGTVTTTLAFAHAMSGMPEVASTQPAPPVRNSPL